MADMQNNDTLALVTGAAGYIGSHMVLELLKQGYRVRGTVRSLDNETKLAHLRSFAKEYGDRLELREGDLLEPGDWPELMTGVHHVYHVASAVLLTAKRPQQEIVDPAVQGTDNVLAAAAATESVTRIGVTSSIAAVTSTKYRDGYTYSEQDWSDDATLQSNPYGMAKRLAEKVAWNYYDGQGDDKRFSLMVVNPVVVIGPVFARHQLRSSPSVIRDVMRGTFKGCPNLGFGLVDVRDVTDVLIEGVQKGKTGRYILHNQSYWMREIADVIADAFPSRKIPRRKIPNAFLYLAAFFDKRLSFAYLRRNLGRERRIDNSRVANDFGKGFRDLNQSIVETCKSFVDLDLV